MAVIVDTSEIQRWGGLLASEAQQVIDRVEPVVADRQAIVIAGAVASAPTLTGALRGSIRPLGKGLNRRVRAGSGKAFYARFQEFGTRKMAANPFLFPQVTGQAQAAFEAQVDRALGQGEVYR